MAACVWAQNLEEDNRPFPAHWIIGNVYYVGRNDIAMRLKWISATTANITHEIPVVSYRNSLHLDRVQSGRLW